MGALSNAAGGETEIVSIDPSSREELGRVRVATIAEVRAAVERAKVAQLEWGALPVRERCRKLAGFRNLVRDHADELAELLSRECGKTRFEALMQEVLHAPSTSCGYFFSNAADFLAPKKIPLHLVKHRASYLHYVPRGVIGIISPWNYPLTIAGGEMVMALVAGNAVVHKPSEVTPIIAQRTRELFLEAGLPGDLYQVVQGRGNVGAALIEAAPDFIHFTGSTATGRKIAAACGERLIPCAVELGGKAPAIVCADADLDRTARALTWGAFANQGQVCASVERVYIHAAGVRRRARRQDPRADVKKLRLGEPRQPEIDCGVMTWERQLEIVESRVKDAVDRGARLEHGGKRRPGGLGFEPTILTNVSRTTWTWCKKRDLRPGHADRARGRRGRSLAPRERLRVGPARLRLHRRP